MILVAGRAICALAYTKRVTVLLPAAPTPATASDNVICDAQLHSLKGLSMLYTIAVILLVAWLLGVFGIYTIGAFVHVLLVIAIVLFLVGLVTGRRVMG